MINMNKSWVYLLILNLNLLTSKEMASMAIELTLDSQRIHLGNAYITLAIPLLYPYGNCSSLCVPGFNYDYSFYMSSQQYNVNNPGTIVQVLNSNPKSSLHNCEYHPTPSAKFTGVEIKDSHTYFYRLPINMCYLCNQSVYEFHFNIDNPTFSMIVTLFGQDFNQSFAAFPLPSSDTLHNTENTLYHYDVLFGPSLTHADATLGGLTIKAMYDQTKVTLDFSGDVITLLKDKPHYSLANQSQVRQFTLCANKRLWIEPLVSNGTGRNASMSGTKITSNKPMMVFTNRAKYNGTHFSYKSQLVHQLPEKREWGTRFLVDTQQVRILPTKSILTYDISILIAHNKTGIVIKYHFLNQSTDVESLSGSSDSDILHSVRVDKNLKAGGVSFIDIRATNPVLVIYDIYTTAQDSAKQLSYSVLVQPTKWHNNIQTIALSDSAQGMDLRYHIGIVIRKVDYDPQNVLVSEENFCNTTPIEEYKGFNLSILANSNKDYAVFYLETSSREMENKTQLLIRHSSSGVKLGVTVFVYSHNLHYAYSNGYAFRSSELKVLQCARDNTASSLLQETVVGSVLAVLGLVTIMVSVSICYYKRKRCNRVESGFTLIQPTAEPDPDYYDFDAFLMFMNEDEWFVRHYIYEPLTRCGYKLLWHCDSSTHLFNAGSNVIDDTREAMEISKKVVFICSKFLTDVDREVAYCKDEQARVKKRRILPVVFENEYASNHFKNYTQIRLKRRELTTQEKEEFLEKMKQNLGPPKYHRRTETALNNIL